MDISIVVITYNYAHYIRECLDSCLNQKNNILDYEIVVINDGSTDNTLEVLKHYDESNVRIYSIKNQGIEKASNFGFKKAKGKYVVRVDSDDKINSNFLYNIKKYINKNFDFIYSDYIVIDGNGNNIEKVFLPKFTPSEIMRRGDFLATGTVFLKKLLIQNNYYSVSNINSGLENYELILRLIKKNIKGKRIKKHLFFYRRHDKNLSVSKQKQIIQNGKKLFAELGIGNFVTNIYHPYKLEVSQE